MNRATAGVAVAMAASVAMAQGGAFVPPPFKAASFQELQPPSPGGTSAMGEAMFKRLPVQDRKPLPCPVVGCDAAGVGNVAIGNFGANFGLIVINIAATTGKVDPPKKGP